jgi:DNA-binding NtrC family response regulator
MAMPIIFITGHGDIPMTVRAMKAGASEFLTKPFRDHDLLNAVEQALHRSRQMAPCQPTPAAETPYAADDLRSDSRFSEIVGHSAALRRVLQQWKSWPRPMRPCSSTARPGQEKN